MVIQLHISSVRWESRLRAQSRLCLLPSEATSPPSCDVDPWPVIGFSFWVAGAMDHVFQN